MENLSFEVSFQRNGIARKFTVPAARQVLHGVYFNGQPYLPDLESVKRAMPRPLHKSIERGCGFWTDKHSDVVSMDLHGYSASIYKQGKPLGTLIAKANWKAVAIRLEGYQYGLLSGCAVKVSKNLYSVSSDCGKVSVRVGAALAESRIGYAAESGAMPVFMYS